MSPDGSSPQVWAAGTGGPPARRRPLTTAERRRQAARTKDEPSDERRRPTFWGLVREFAILAVLALVLAFLFKTFLVQAFFIPSGSMESTLQISDRVLVEKLPFNTIEHGDIIVFAQDGGPERSGLGVVGGFFRDFGEGIGLVRPDEKDFIKRVVGLPGDEITCAEGLLVRNGEVVDEPYVRPETPTRCDQVYTVGEGQLFVMGDNRTNSADSRDDSLGFVDQDTVVGEAFFRIAPLGRFGTLD